MPPDQPPKGSSVAHRAIRKDARRNREQLIRAARSVFAEKGFDASMDEIASRAQLGVGTAYRHFANKYELANAIFERAVETFVASAGAVTATPDPWDALVAVIERVLSAQTGNRAIREILLDVHRDGSEYHAGLIAPLSAAFVRARTAGAVRVDADWHDLVGILVMLCAVTDLGEPYAPELWRRYLPTLLADLRSGVPTATPS